MIMKKPLKILQLIAFIFCFSCEDQGLIVKCPDCTADEPVDTLLDIKFDSGFSKDGVIINIYEGNLEDSILYNTYNIKGTVINATVTLNKKYTVTATYTYDQGTKYIAVDSATPKVKYEKDQCDDPCFFVYDKTVDLRLKYTK
jgi:hypothetical protein